MALLMRVNSAYSAACVVARSPAGFLLRIDAILPIFNALTATFSEHLSLTLILTRQVIVFTLLVGRICHCVCILLKQIISERGDRCINKGDMIGIILQQLINSSFQWQRFLVISGKSHNRHKLVPKRRLQIAQSVSLRLQISGRSTFQIESCFQSIC